MILRGGGAVGSGLFWKESNSRDIQIRPVWSLNSLPFLTSYKNLVMYQTFSQNRNHSRLYSPQEIETMYRASAAQPDLFDNLLDEKHQWADAESTAKMEEHRMDEEPQ